jgi:predicted ester cyclase
MASSNADAERNVATMKRIVMEVQQDANYALIDEMTSPDFYNHTASGGLPTDRSGVHAVMQYIHSAFSNIKMEIVHCISQSDIIATNKVLYGDHTGEFLGNQPDGERKQMRIMDFVTVVDGQMKEHWAILGTLEEVKS